MEDDREEKKEEKRRGGLGSQIGKRPLQYDRDKLT